MKKLNPKLHTESEHNKYNIENTKRSDVRYEIALYEAFLIKKTG